MGDRRIGLVVHEGREAAVDAAHLVHAWAKKNAIEVIEIDVWRLDNGHRPRRNAKDEVEAAGHPSLIVTIGGDGTFLRGVRVAASDDVPVLGVNVGRVGFLTEVEPAEIESALEAFFSGSARMDERMMLTMRASRPLEIPDGIQALLQYGRGPLLPPPPRRMVSQDNVSQDQAAGMELDVTALNDVVFEKLARDRQASLAVYLGESVFASYSADALIVASPTGSTAYNLSRPAGRCCRRG
ncbi:NAD(+)/NADH kinase [Fodinicola feengrottensis]|uniref:NAD(+)/NADH kinase n=1 Tax=Fodinicola feengrottensis TaxID=435914 RepID=UPI0024417CCF|nr:NAD(+)/NADH kinase [Fodinicola feengrottensis]